MPQIQIAEKLLPLIVTPKRVKIAVGGRGGSKSIAFADAFLKFCEDGERLCCAREFQNSIEESVHPLMVSRIRQLEADCSPGASSIQSPNGGEIFYKGLARNPLGMKSMFGVKRIWVEEAQGLSDITIDMLEPTIREGDSELWFSLNRGSSKDPFAKRMLAPYEKHLERSGFYEDDDVIIVEINWWDNPWFPEVLNRSRLKDKKNLPRAKYDHIWNGKYADTVENAIIEPEWFDACIDAHIKLGFKPLGQERVAYDPADSGDAKAVAYTHGAVVLDVRCNEAGSIDTATDWACDFAIAKRPDTFTWDADGMGMGLKRQISDAFEGKKIIVEAFSGASGADFPDKLYDRIDGEVKDSKTNQETFANKRAQYYWMLRDRMFRTYLAVKSESKVTDPDDLISFSSQIQELSALRAELCRIPRKFVGSGRIQLMSKPDMKSKLQIESPNMADAVMMCMRPVEVKRDRRDLKKVNRGIV